MQQHGQSQHPQSVLGDTLGAHPAPPEEERGARSPWAQQSPPSETALTCGEQLQGLVKVQLPHFAMAPLNHHPSHTPMSGTPSIALPLPRALCLPAGHLRSCSSSPVFHLPPFPPSHSQRLFLAKSSKEKSPEIGVPMGVALSPSFTPDIPSLVTASTRARQVGKAGNAPLNSSEVWGSQFQALVPPAGMEHPEHSVHIQQLGPHGTGDTGRHFQESPHRSLPGRRAASPGLSLPESRVCPQGPWDGINGALGAAAGELSRSEPCTAWLQPPDLPQRPGKGRFGVRTRLQSPGQLPGWRQR